jgi:hypothetical protein
VQRLPSLQSVPSFSSGFVHRPVAVSQVPTSWHWSSAVHTTGLAPTQTPDWHVSERVQPFPSSQGVPGATVGSAQSTAVRTATDAGLEIPDVDPGPSCRAGAASLFAVRA